MKSGLALLLVCATAVTASASVGRPADVQTRARGAERVLVAVVDDVVSRFDVNEHGDRLILSQVSLRVEQTLKGAQGSVATVDVEGGTVGALTLHVSDMPGLRRGERAVFFLSASRGGVHRLHGRGLGVLKLDAGNRVQGSTMTLDDVAAGVRAAQR